MHFVENKNGDVRTDYGEQS